jgi:hypothetical protein
MGQEASLFKTYAKLIIWYERLPNKHQREGFKEAFRALDTVLSAHGEEALMAMGMANSTIWNLLPYPKCETLIADRSDLEAVFEKFKKCIDYQKKQLSQ